MNIEQQPWDRSYTIYRSNLHNDPPAAIASTQTPSITEFMKGSDVMWIETHPPYMN